MKAQALRDDEPYETQVFRDAEARRKAAASAAVVSVAPASPAATDAPTGTDSLHEAPIVDNGDDHATVATPGTTLTASAVEGESEAMNPGDESGGTEVSLDQSVEREGNSTASRAGTSPNRNNLAYYFPPWYPPSNPESQQKTNTADKPEETANDNGGSDTEEEDCTAFYRQLGEATESEKAGAEAL
eukprot:scaffold34141_cov74-Phaeocystis_antarctica.AAC.1